MLEFKFDEIRSSAFEWSGSSMLTNHRIHGIIGLNGVFSLCETQGCASVPQTNSFFQLLSPPFILHLSCMVWTSTDTRVHSRKLRLNTRVNWANNDPSCGVVFKSVSWLVFGCKLEFWRELDYLLEKWWNLKKIWKNTTKDICFPIEDSSHVNWMNATRITVPVGSTDPLIHWLVSGKRVVTRLTILTRLINWGYYWG